ncbi:MAG: response regulator [Lachnospiraceae bacterium]|nr:response regulator [Lachnospiraceae bacterium]
MFHQIYDRYFGEQVSDNRRVFNSIHLIAVIGLLCSTILTYLYIPGKVPFYTCIGTVIFFMLTAIEANRINNTKIPVVIMSFAFNNIFLAMVYLSYGRLVCMIPIYFIFGLLYTVLLLNDKWGLIITIIQTIFYLGLIIYASRGQISPLLQVDESFRDYSGIFIAIAVAGVFGGLAVWYRIRIQQEERKKADAIHAKIMEDYISKDIFLLNMSHEIRTPMNAIVGTVNLMLDQNVNDRVRDSVYNILNSCNALLSITNELMDVSKADSRQITVNTVKFDFGEFLYEIINMISVRLMDTGVDLYVEIDKKIPQYLYGDTSRLRQLFINILNNAVKYTQKGKIILRVICDEMMDETISLRVEVEDTGIGIRSEDLPKLFRVYERIHEDDEKQRGVEGTGLGLPICKEILNKLNGEIHVKSQYGVGSVFDFELALGVQAEPLLLSGLKTDRLNVLIYEKNEEAQSFLLGVLNTLGVSCQIPEDTKEFEEMILSRKFSHLLIAYERYMENIRFLDTMILSEKLILITDISRIVSLNKYGSIITRPAHALNVMAALGNRSNNYVHEIIRKGGFSCPGATLLVVDDNLTNLTVAGGLLKKYDATILTALSGMECLNILENNHVDLVFMDYMMPEMNGIDTLIKIREMEDPHMKSLPVIALTANVVNGAKEMFLDAGFDDYIAKPIEVDRIERALRTHLPRELIVVKQGN